MAKFKHLVLMCGVPGSGKSTVANNMKMRDTQNRVIIISRDAIRFALVAEDEPYFSREKLVFDVYCKKIQEAIDNINGPEFIICDATHINQASRNKVLDQLKLDNVHTLSVIVVRPSLDETLKRNRKRFGRERVPDSAIKRMYEQFEDPIEDKKYTYNTIFREVKDNEQDLANI